MRSVLLLLLEVFCACLAVGPFTQSEDALSACADVAVVKRGGAIQGLPSSASFRNILRLSKESTGICLYIFVYLSGFLIVIRFPLSMRWETVIFYKMINGGDCTIAPKLLAVLSEARARASSSEGPLSSY